jgi:hypothetical protein
MWSNFFLSVVKLQGYVTRRRSSASILDLYAWGRGIESCSGQTFFLSCSPHVILHCTKNYYDKVLYISKIRNHMALLALMSIPDQKFFRLAF